MVDRAGILMQQGATIAAERVYDNSSMSHSHYHPHFELYYLEEGTRLHMLENDIYQTDPGDIMLFAPFIMHHSYSKKLNADFKRIALYFTPESIEDPFVLEKLKKSSGLYHVDSKVGHYLHGMLGMLLMEQNNDDDLHDASMKALLNIIVISLLKTGVQESKPESQTLVGQVIDYIDSNYMNDIKLDDLANHFFVSKYYLCHEFKKYTNRTINQYINTTRILYSQQKIMDNNLNFTEIAAACGFASCTHFGRTFKSVTGVTPSEFKSNYRKKIKKEK
ncbi:MAG: AraC family transcriptional regulator [Lachnospiraceae bacterium]|nr:AraC family transcriptional regulator [Lachnospiraceae bacterium]